MCGVESVRGGECAGRAVCRPGGQETCHVDWQLGLQEAPLLDDGLAGCSAVRSAAIPDDQQLLKNTVCGGFLHHQSSLCEVVPHTVRWLFMYHLLPYHTLFKQDIES